MSISESESARFRPRSSSKSYLEKQNKFSSKFTLDVIFRDCVPSYSSLGASTFDATGTEKYERAEKYHDKTSVYYTGIEPKRHQ